MTSLRDPFPYDGPIQRIDGTRPFNRYLWPTECWPAYGEPEFQRPHVPYDFRIEIIALADGRFSIAGFVWEIERGRYMDNQGEPTGRRCVFDTRAEAIRASAYELIVLARRCIRDDRWASARTMDCRHRLPDVIAWARRLVARETSKPEPRPLTTKMPAPKPRPMGLPLFDHELGVGA